MRYLVIANQEDGYEALAGSIAQIAATEPESSFFVIVPLGHRSHHPLALAEARKHAATHLADVQRHLAAQGLAAPGEVADHQLMMTVEQLVTTGDVDAVIVSAPPTALRAAVGLDQVDHIRRMFPLPVIRLADPDANCLNRRPTEQIPAVAQNVTGSDQRANAPRDRRGHGDDRSRAGTPPASDETVETVDGSHQRFGTSPADPPNTPVRSAGTGFRQSDAHASAAAG